MVALWNRADHYIFALWFLLLSSFFVSRLISAVADWMYVILPNMVRPYCKFQMQVSSMEMKGHYFQPSLFVCLSVCVCVSDRHFYPSTFTDFDETWGGVR